MRLTADKIKAIVAGYWRYHMQCPFVALEADCNLGPWKDYGAADVLVINKKRQVIETEVKVTIADLKQDVKKAKHVSFSCGKRDRVTSYFYFAVPKELANKACLVCNEMYPYAGVLGTDGSRPLDVRVYRQPKELVPDRRLEFRDLLRMCREQSATVCRLAMKVVELRERRSGEGDKYPATVGLVGPEGIEGRRESQLENGVQGTAPGACAQDC
jgi:hypothetical protein